MSVFEKLLHDLENDPKVAKEVALGKRIRLYRIREQLGTGNFSKVKLGVHLLTKEKVAIKIIDKTGLDDRARKILSREILCMERLSHPNLIRLYEVVESVQKMHIIMEYAPGGELSQKVNNNGPYSEVDAKPIFIQVANAICYMHNKEIIHRDLKAENVFFALSGDVKVGDFGFSTISGSSQYLDTFCGSPPYAAPELFKDEQYLGPPVDVWAMGVLLIFVVTARLPFTASTVQELKQLVLSSSYQLPAHLSPEITLLINGMLVHNPTDRYCIANVFTSTWIKDINASNKVDYDTVTLGTGDSDVMMQEVMTKLTSWNVPIGNLETLKDLRDAAGGTYNITLHQVERQHTSTQENQKSYAGNNPVRQQDSTQERNRSRFCSLL